MQESRQLTHTFNTKGNNLSEIVKNLGKSHFKLARDYTDFKKDMTTVVNGNVEAIGELKWDLVRVNKDLYFLNEHFETQLKHINSSLHMLEKRGRAVKIVSTLTSKLLDDKLSVFDKMIDFCDLIIDSLTTLMDNKLPRKLMTPDRLSDILNHASNQLMVSHPNYIFALDKLQYYYKLDNIGFIDSQDRLIINLAIPIKLATQEPFVLYRIETVYLPANLSRHDNKPQAYTKLNLDVDFIAVNGDDFVELTATKLLFCNNFGNYYICYDTLLMIHKNEVTCVLAIFGRLDLQKIRTLCTFDYYPKLKPTA